MAYFFNILKFYSSCDVAILSGSLFPARDYNITQTVKMTIKLAQIKKSSPNFLDPKSYNSDCFEIFGEYRNSDQIYFKKLSKTPSRVFFGKNFTVKVISFKFIKNILCCYLISFKTKTSLKTTSPTTTHKYLRTLCCTFRLGNLWITYSL